MAEITNTLAFGDNVRVLRTPDTERAGIAGSVGCIYGFTTPSITNVEVIGELAEDCAFNVHFDTINKAFWFPPHLLEFVDHSPGTEAWLQGSPTKSVRQPDGSWLEVPVERSGRGRLRKFIQRVFGRGRA